MVMLVRTCMSYWYKIARKCSQKSICRIIILTVIVISLYTFTTKITSKKTIFTAARHLGPAYTLLQNNGSSHIDEIPALSHLPETARLAVYSDLRDTVQQLVEHCVNENIASRTKCRSDYRKRNILTLFTTWIYDKDKFSVNNNTLHNWKTLPGVNLVVFSNSTDVQQYSQAAGWSGLPVLEEADGAPVLPAMFKETMARFDSAFYGYVNGDILFTGSLIDTLDKILCQLKNEVKNRGMLIVGRRTNLLTEYIDSKTALSWGQLKDKADKHGTIFQTNAEDYFITNKKFPWDRVLPVAVGRRGYDNWMVAYSRYMNLTVIDATETILCVHQTLTSRGNYEGLTKGDYNIDLVENLRLPFEFRSWGNTDCSEFRTWYNLCGTISFTKRSNLDEVCTSYNFQHKLMKLFSG